MAEFRQYDRGSRSNVRRNRPKNRQNQNGSFKGTDDSRRERGIAGTILHDGNFNHRTPGEDRQRGKNRFTGKLIEQLIQDYSDQLQEVEQEFQVIQARRKRLKRRLKELKDLHTIEKSSQD
jgi:hypothetical protein